MKTKSRRDELHALLHQIRYQYPVDVPATTICQCCTQGCEQSARGSSKCGYCLEAELAELIGSSHMASAVRAYIEGYSRLMNQAFKTLDDENQS